MKKVKVSIQDENTLILQEAAEKGDVIDLKSIHETDIDKTTVTNVVNSIKRDAFNAELEKVKAAIEREKALEAEIKEQKLRDRVALLEKEKESAVKLAESRGVALDQLPLADLQAIDSRIDERVFAALSVEASVAARASHGGTAPEQVRKRVTEARKALGME